MPQSKNPVNSEPDPPDVSGGLGALRERLVSSVTLSTDRLQETVEDAVRRGRMTRKDAEDLLATLVALGRAQSEALLSDLEQLLGRGGAGWVTRKGRGGSSFPIEGYDELTAAEVCKLLKDLTPAQLRKVRDHERRHAARKSVLGAIERRLA